jgi:hypothetical protein
MPTISTAAPTWQKVTVTHTQLQAAALVSTIELFTLPAAGVIHAVKIKHSVAFAGTDITAYTVKVGITGALQKYADDFNVLQAVAATTFAINSTFGSEDHGTATSIKVTATSVGANLSASSAGSVDIWVLHSTAM